jgi:hypothetical protein
MSYIQELSQLLTSNSTLIVSIGGAFVAGVTTVTTTIITRRSEERKHIKGLFMTTALEEWKTKIDVLGRVKRGATVFPAETQLIHFSKIYDRIIDKNLSETDLARVYLEIVKESKSFCDIIEANE